MHYGDPANIVRFGTGCLTKCFDYVLLSFFGKSSTKKRRSNAPLIGLNMPTDHPTNNDDIPRQKAPSNFISHRYGASTVQWRKSRLCRSPEPYNAFPSVQAPRKGRLEVSTSVPPANSSPAFNLFHLHQPTSCRRKTSCHMATSGSVGIPDALQCLMTLCNIAPKCS